MAQFNLINLGTIQSNTTSGTGNIELSDSDLGLLCDGALITYGATVSGTGVLCLDIDLGYRVRLDAFNLIATVSNDRAVALEDINFYYKYVETDEYIVCAKNCDLDKFYASGFPVLFTPQYLRITVNNPNLIIYELEALNDDTQVSFGESGNESLIILDQVVDGYNTLGIFNNSSIGSKPVNAYVMVDYSGEDSDYYIKLSSSVDGEYCGLADGIYLKSNDLSQSYTWDMGIFDNVIVDSNINLKSDVDNLDIVGHYTTPILSIDDVFNNTFLISDYSVVSGTSLTAQIRSCDEEPLPFNKLFWFWRAASTNNGYIYVGDMTSGYEESTYMHVWTDSAVTPISIKFDRYRSNIYTLYKNGSSEYRIRKYNYVSKSGGDYSSYSTLNNISYCWDLDSDGCVWGYVKQSGFRIVRYNYSFSERVTIKEDSSSDFLGDLSATKTYPTCWYTNTTQNTLEHLDSDGGSIVSITVNAPSFVTALPDGGCWVVSAGDSKLIQFSYYGTEQRSVAYSSTTVVNSLKFGTHSALHPFNDLCLWMLLDYQRIVQIDFEGNTISETYLSNISSIEPFSGGCLVYCSAASKTYQLNEEGIISYVWDHSSYANGCGQPYPVVVYYEEFVDMAYSDNILPLTNDPYWAADKGWRDIPLIGHKLPFFKYHQARFEFTPLMEKAVLINSDAEIGTNVGWVNEVESCNISSSNVYEGSYSFTTGVDASGSGYKIACYTRVNLDSISMNLMSWKTTFYAKCRIAGFSSTPGYASQTFGIGLRFRDDNESGSTVISTVYGDAVVGSSQSVYYLATASAVLPENSKYIDVFVWYIYTTSYNYMQFDAVELYAFNSSELKSIVIPKPVIVNDIQPQEFKNIYIKKEIPSDAAYKEYETKLKCWWGNEEE